MKINVLVRLSKLSDKGVCLEEFVSSFLTVFDADFLPCSPHPKLYFHSDFSFQGALTVYFF